jgi:hypothetical protein
MPLPHCPRSPAVADAQSPSLGRPGASRAAATAPALEASPAPSGVPASWAGFGALLAGAGGRTPADALRLAAVAAGDTRTGPTVDLSGMWALPADPASPGSDTLIRARDGKGRARPHHMINKRARTSLGMAHCAPGAGDVGRRGAPPCPRRAGGPVMPYETSGSRCAE